jgi:hypothetical protein
MGEKIIELLEDLTLSKVLLAIFASVSGITLYTVWEQRNAVFATLTGSIFAMSSMAAGIGFLFVAAICWLFVAALDRKTDLTQKAMGDRIADLQRQVTEQRKDMARMQSNFEQALEDEKRECKERLNEMRENFNTMLIRARV